MASLWKHPRSKYWYGCYTAADGRQLKRTTRETDKRKARIIAEAWEAAESLGRRGMLTSREQLYRVLEQTVERITGKPFEHYSVREWFTRWLKGEQGAVSVATLKRYRQVIGDFLSFLATRAEIRLEGLTTEDFAAFRDHLLARGLAPRTVNVVVRKILKRPVSAAVNDGILKRNPVASIRHLRDVRSEKGVFTPEQVRSLVEAADSEWQGLILFGYFTGGRLNDLAQLRWQSIDLAERSISFTQKKTEARIGAKKIKVPLHPELEDYLLSLSVPDTDTEPIFPRLSRTRSTGKSGLSATFKRIMEKAGIDAGIARQKCGEGGRSVSALSFHSLRHSFTSALANAGIPAEVRQKLTGHADARSHALLTPITNLKACGGAWKRLRGCLEAKEASSEQAITKRVATVAFGR
jgi:integrase